MVIYPAVKPTIENRYILLENYQVENVRVPKGYKTNGGVEVIINDDLSALDAFYITVQGQEV